MSGPVARATGERFWSKVNKTETCWLWTAYRARGYGRFMVGAGEKTRALSAHRWSWEQEHGAVPDGLELDHLCRTPACVRPAHLEPVTHAENVRRAAAAVVACPQGHAYDKDNTYRRDNGKRQCRKCAAVWARLRRTYA